MQYVNGDLWRFALRDDAFVVVPTNTTLKMNGDAVMGKGVAKDAATRYPLLPRLLGDWIRSNGSEIMIYKPIVCLPTKTNWRDPSDVNLISDGCHDLEAFSTLLDRWHFNHVIYLPRIGCGLGGLDWERTVRPMVDSILISDRFVCVSPP